MSHKKPTACKVIAMVALTLLLSSSPSLAQLKITKIVNNVPQATKEYPTLVTNNQDKAWYQQKTYRNNSGQQASISIFVTGSTPTTQPSSLIKQGYYISTGQSSDPLRVLVTSPEFSCSSPTGKLEVKVFKAAYSQNLFKGELNCGTNKIVYELGNGQPFIGAALNVSNIASHTASSQQTGYEAIKLLSNGAWRSGNTKKDEKITFMFNRPARIYSIAQTVRRNFTKLAIEGQGDDAWFNQFFTFSYVGNPPSDLFNLPTVSFAAWHVAPRIKDLTIDVTKYSAATIAEINRMTIIPENYSAWKNHLCPEDVNNDGRISSLDALTVINYLNSPEDRVLSTLKLYNDSRPFYDVSGDGVVSSLDALTVINALNNGKRSCSVSTSLEGEGEATSLVSVSDNENKSSLNSF